MIVREEKKNVPGQTARFAARRIGLAMSMLLAVAMLVGGSAPAWAITGGSTVFQHPSLVIIELQSGSNWWQLANGVIIDQKNILTSAHAVAAYKSTPQKLRILAGMMDCRGGNTVHPVKGIDLDFAPIPGVTYANDIAILHLQSPMTYSEYLQPAALPEAGPSCDSPNFVGQTVSIIGFGRTAPNGPIPWCAQKADFDVITTAQANSVWGPFGGQVWDCQLPVHDSSNQAAIMQGDLGAPVFGIDQYGNEVLVGIVSWSASSGSPKFPAVTTRVSCYLCWIQTHLW